MTLASQPPSVTVGIIGGLSAAIFYTLANIALRSLVSVDPFLVSAVKAYPTLVLLTPMMLMAFLPRLASPKTTAGEQAGGVATFPIPWRFVGIALVGQVLGNGGFQVALGSIGLAASVPITLGSLLIGGAVLGRVFLGEPVRVRTACSIAILLIAVVLLSWTRSHGQIIGAAKLGTWSPPPWVGAVGAVLSGWAFAFFSSLMRRTMKRGMSSVQAMWISGLAGSVGLSAITVGLIGWEPVTHVTSHQWWQMIAAGTCNFIAFVAISTALRALPVVAVHLLNASQVAMAAVAGVVLFHEAVTGGLLTGIFLTIFGLVILIGGKRGDSRSL